MPINYNEYPPNWKTEIRPRILERESNCCKDCGVPNYAIIYRDNGQWYLAPEGHAADAMALDGVKFIKVILTVAHLDHDKENWKVKDERLAALCQKCHLGYDAPEKAKKKSDKKYINSLFPNE